MQIILNGQNKECAGPKTLDEIIQESCADNKHVIAEVNGQIIKAPHWTETTLNNGDAIELVNFVGGG